MVLALEKTDNSRVLLYRENITLQYGMSGESETFNFELLVPSKGISYFRKYGTDEKVSAINSKIVPLQKNGTVYENARGLRYVVIYLLKLLK